MALSVIDGTGQTKTLGSVASDAVYRASAIYALDETTDQDTLFIQGSDTKTVRIRKIEFISFTDGSAAVQQLKLKRRSTANSGGTAVAPTVAKMDSGASAATAVVKHITAKMTDGTAVADLWSGFIVQASGTTYGTAGTPLKLDFTACPIVLRGTTDLVTLYMEDAAVGNSTGYYTIEWEES